MGPSEYIALAALVVAALSAFFAFRQNSLGKRANKVSEDSAQASKKSALAAEKSASEAVKANEYSARSAAAAEKSNQHAAASAQAAKNQDARETERVHRERYGWKIKHCEAEIYTLENLGTEIAFIHELAGSSAPRLIDPDAVSVYPSGEVKIILDADFPYEDRKIKIHWGTIEGDPQHRQLNLP